MCVGQTGDMFHEPTIPSELSPDAAADDDDVDADHHIVGEDEEAELDEGGGASSDEEEQVVETADDLVVTAAQRQHSTTEYLPGMLHSNSPPGLLPKFPSWSLLQLGDYSSYNPSTGNDIGVIVTSVVVHLLRVSVSPCPHQ